MDRLSTIGDRAFPLAGAWKPPLEQSATRRHLSSNAHCFSEPPQDLTFSRSFSAYLFLYLVLYTVFNSVLTVLYLGHSK